jgi:hypothetical protein
MRRMVFRGVILFLSLWLINTAFAVPPYQLTSPENLFQVVLRDLRADMELLASRAFPGGRPPEAWTGNLDYTADNMLADLFVDNELLADQIFGAGQRPEDWIGVATYIPDLVARNIRHDLELSADEFLGFDLRPDEWIGGPLLFRCNHTLMNTVYLLDVFYNIRPRTPETVLDYCAALEDEVEDELVFDAIGTAQLENIPELILAVRGDLERLADEVLGVNNRPEGWLRNLDIESPTLASDIVSDLEMLADVILQGQRPETWITSGGLSQIASYRTMRFNLELLADRALGVGRRPNGWQGESEIFRCQPNVQNLVALTERAYNYTLPVTDAIGPAYCAQVLASVNFAVENPPRPEEIDAAEEAALEFTAESRNAFAYLDQAAIQYMGVLPWGTGFRAWYRNFGESSMMFVSGEEFAVYIDRRWTTMEQEAFDRLPTLDGVQPLTFCDANWCNGPAPTPTPTGSGPLLEIIFAGTPPAEVGPPVTPDADTTGKRLVNWNHIRVNYLLNREDIGRVQVSLEICEEPNQVVCEPVVSVFDITLNAPVPVVSLSGGLNVYELPFGYSTNYAIEGTTLFSNDIWINDPSLQSP